MKGCAPLQRAEPTERSPPTAGLLDSPYTKPTNCSWSPGASILASCAAASVAAARKSALSGAFRHTWRARAATASRTSGWRLQHRQAGRQAAGGGVLWVRAHHAQAREVAAWLHEHKGGGGRTCTDVDCSISERVWRRRMVGRRRLAGRISPVHRLHELDGCAARGRHLGGAALALAGCAAQYDRRQLVERRHRQI